MYRCPCCGYYTLSEKPPGTDEICEVCFWHDDCDRGVAPDSVMGANKISLNQAKKNFKKFGAKEERHIFNVRSPKKNELHGDA